VLCTGGGITRRLTVAVLRPVIRLVKIIGGTNGGQHDNSGAERSIAHGGDACKPNEAGQFGASDSG
jgi:hypothetical protein